MPARNDTFTGTVRDLSSEGTGVVEHASGQVFFVPGVWPGEEAEFRVVGFRKRFGFARLVRLLRPSPDRTEPRCPHHGLGGNDCGGCPWQFIRYEAQLQAKETRIREALARLDADTAIRPIIPSPLQFGYRNRAQFKSDGERIGYVAQNSNRLVAIEECPVLSPHNRETLRLLRDTLPNSAFKPRRKAPWTTLDIDEEVSADGVYINRRRPFRQANDAQNQRMKSWLAEKLQPLDKTMAVLELFAGSGNFTEVLAGAGFGRILAVEGADEAVAILADRQLANVEVTSADLFAEEGAARVARELPDTGLLLLDPPRDGFRAIGTLLEQCSGINDILYISCNPATFLRDLQACIDRRFRVDEVQPIDLFPHTPHIEVMAALHRG